MRLAEYPDDIGFATAIGIARTDEAIAVSKPVHTPERFADEAALFQRLGLSKPLISVMLERAERNGSTLEAELLASGALTESTYREALAEMLGLPFRPVLDACLVHDMADTDLQLLAPFMVRLNHPEKSVTALVPSADRMVNLARVIEAAPALAERLVATTPSALKAAVWEAGAERRLRETTSRLFDTRPETSARITLFGRQGFYAGAGLAGLAGLAIAFPFEAAHALHVVLSFVFLAAVALRFCALFAGGGGRADTPPRPSRPPPVYSVFVALYQEARVVPQLIGALDRIEWPRSRLDIKLICEADDGETLDALARMDLGPHYEIVAVPPSLPRTKPKALAYALPAARGEFLVIYDAEDRPHPLQLEEAWRTFEAGPPELACLQAPLVIDNARESWISALFALEYAGLFRRLLPFLAARDLPVPLGGTSNHFRTGILQQSGGWDPYNVTEDADIGLRLFRLGHRCGVLRRPTMEDAPTDLAAWTSQRTRWFKGWLQTWLVLMRRPGRLVGDMGLWPATVFQLLIGGLLVSSLAHPVIFVYIAVLAWMLMQQAAFSLGPFALALFVIDIVNIFGSYAVFIALGRAGMTPRERAAVGRRWLAMPVYWLLMSRAAWRSIRELRTKPFAWNKTAHRPARTDHRLLT